MNFFKLLSVFALVAIIGCESNQKEEVVIQTDDQNPDELLQGWNDAWNQNNYDSVSSYLADDAVFLLQGEAYSTSEGKQWLKENSAITTKLKADSKLKNATNDIVYQAGTYSHGMKANDSLANQDAEQTGQNKENMAMNDSLRNFNGAFTLIWERENNDEWKLKLINITGQMDTTSVK